MSLGPDEVLRHMAELTRQALAADSDTLEELELPDDRLLVVSPEENHSGPTPASLVFSIGAVGAASALGRLGMPPAEAHAYSVWRKGVMEGLEALWGANGRETMRLIGWCLQWDPFDRPHPKHLVAELDPTWRSPSRSMGHTVEPSLTRAPPPQPNRADQRLSVLIGAVLTVALMLFAFASCGLLTLWMMQPGQPAPTQAPTRSVVSSASSPVPAPAPAEVVPAPALQPLTESAHAPVSEPAPRTDVQNDLIDPWE